MPLTFCSVMDITISFVRGKLWLYLKKLQVQATSLLTYDHSELLCDDQIPSIMIEPFIQTGYRPLDRPWGYYVKSIARIHNETLNVWTHIAGVLILLVEFTSVLNHYNITQDKAVWPIVVFLLTCMAVLLISATAHLLSSKSAWTHDMFFLLDYCGVTIYGFGSGIGNMYTSSSQLFHTRWSAAYLPLLVLVTCFSFFICCVSKLIFPSHPARKPVIVLGVTVQWIFATWPVSERYLQCLSDDSCSLHDLNHLTMVIFMHGMCALSYVGHFPERWKPRSFDIIGHSHQIFHVVNLATQLCQLKALQIDKDLHDGTSVLDPSLILLAFACLLLTDAVTLVVTARVVLRMCRQVKSETTSTSKTDVKPGLEEVANTNKDVLSFDTNLQPLLQKDLPNSEDIPPAEGPSMLGILRYLQGKKYV